MDAYLLPNAQLPLFSEERLPHKPYCSNGLEYGVKIRSLRHALSMPYIQVNPPHLCCWMLFDIDREQGGSAWIDAGLPMPYWTAQNVVNGHAHTAWGLSAPVLKGDSARNAPMPYSTVLVATAISSISHGSGRTARYDNIGAYKAVTCFG